MDANTILDRLSTLGVSVRAEDGNVLIQPASKAPQDLKDAIRENKSEVLTLLAKPPNTEDFLTRLRKGQAWLLDQHNRWQAGDTTSADDEAFSRAWAGWWDLDARVRADFGFQGCVHGPDGACPDGFPCQGCSEIPEPSVVAQLELA